MVPTCRELSAPWVTTTLELLVSIFKSRWLGCAFWMLMVVDIFQMQLRLQTISQT